MTSKSTKLSALDLARGQIVRANLGSGGKAPSRKPVNAGR